MEPLSAVLFDEACAQHESLGQVDGICDSPLTQQGKYVEVEGVEMEPEERSMKGWCQVRRKNSQEEKEAAAETRGWEEFKSSYPYLAHYWRRGKWREEVKVMSVEQLKKREAGRKLDSCSKGGWPSKSEVERWHREDGESWG